MGCNMRIILADLSLSFNLFGCSIEAKAAWTKSFPTVIFDSPSCLAALREDRLKTSFPAHQLTGEAKDAKDIHLARLTGAKHEESAL